MYPTKRTIVKKDMLLSGLVSENPSFLLMMEHFGINFIVQNKTVEQVCNENEIRPEVFISIANLYNGLYQNDNRNFTDNDIQAIVTFLKNSHHFYLNEKYPEIYNLIQELYLQNDTTEIKLVEKFFLEYFSEVKEHLEYEDKIAYPYFLRLQSVEKLLKAKGQKKFSANDYHKHHTDIEFKLTELKNLLLMYIPLKNDRVLRRKLLFALFELEFDLKIHSIIEETILIPLIKVIEQKQSNG